MAASPDSFFFLHNSCKASSLPHSERIRHSSLFFSYSKTAPTQIRTRPRREKQGWNHQSTSSLPRLSINSRSINVHFKRKSYILVVPFSRNLKLPPSYPPPLWQFSDPVEISVQLHSLSTYNRWAYSFSPRDLVRIWPKWQGRNRFFNRHHHYPRLSV